MTPAPSILSNLAFHQSPLWTRSTSSICQTGETPDDLGALRQAWRLLRLRPRFDAVVTMGPRPSLAYGLLCALLRLPSRQILSEVFLDDPRPSSPAWRLKTALFRLVARRAFGLLTNSSAEIALLARRFDLPENRLRFVPLSATLLPPARVPDHDGSVLSIGRTLRDLDTLMSAARELQAPVVVVAGARDRLPTPPPPNVRILREIPLAQTHDLLRRAAVVVIPLRPAERSTGQVVLLEALALGKPVVATRAVGTADYIRDGETGFLVPPGDAPALARAVRRLLDDPALADRLGSRAVDDCLSRWLPDQHARARLQAIADLATSPP